MEYQMDKGTENSGTFDFSDILYKYLSYWPLFVALLVSMVTAAYLFLRYATPIYEVSSTILIKDNKKGINETNIAESLDMFGYKKVVENEIEALRSRTLMKEVVNNLKLYTSVSFDGIIKDLPVYTKSPVKIEAKNPDKLSKGEKIRFTVSRDNSIIIKGKPFPLNQWTYYGSDTLKFTRNPVYKKPLSEETMYFSFENPKKMVSKLVSKLDIVSSNKQATIINLKYKDAIPERGEDILNELIRVYNKAAIEDKNLMAENTLTFVEVRLNHVVHELDSIEAAVERFKTRKGIVDINEQGKNFLQSVEINDRQVNEMTMQIVSLDQVETYVTSKGSHTGIVPSTFGLNDPALNQLLQRLYDLEIEYEKLRKTTAENNPLLISVQDQIDKVKPGILENIRNQRNILTVGKNNLSTTIARYAGVLKDIPQNERELLEITRQQVIKNNIYTFLLQKREETALSFASTVADSRILDAPSSGGEPVSPNKKLVYLMAIFGSFGLAIGYIYFKEALNRTVRNRNEISKSLSWPVIGEIPYSPAHKTIVVKSEDRNIVAEQFRHLRTSLSSLGINDKNKKILITSSIAGEGKTFIAANLAMSMALAHKKVVLVELDLRKPTLSAIFKIKRDKGLTNYLRGECGKSEIIKESGNKNLWFIPCGPIPFDPSELILDKSMEALMQHLEKEFDHVIINTPPIVPVTDAIILSKLCDTTLFIVRQGFTPRADLKRVQENNSIRELKNVGIIFNGVKGVKYEQYGNGYEMEDRAKTKGGLKSFYDKSLQNLS